MAGEYLDFLERRCAKLEYALERIRDRELPSTGKFYDNDPSRPYLYETAWGSQGAKQYIRNVAAEALS